MKKVIMSIFGVLFFSVVSAQFFMPIAERVEKAEQRILLIEQGGFECSGEIEGYFKKYWSFGKGVEIKTTDEIDALLTKDKAFDYMVLSCDQKMEAKINDIVSPVIGIVLYLGENARLRKELNIDRKFVFKVSFPSCVISEAEVIFIAEHFNNYLKNPSEKNQKKSVIPNEKVKSLQNITLLIPESATELSISEIKKAYKYPVELMPVAEIEKKILAKEAGFAYVNILWSDKRFAWVSAIIACENSEVLTVGKNDYFKASVSKKKYDRATQPLAVCRSKSKLAAYEFKTLNKTILTAIQEP